MARCRHWKSAILIKSFLVTSYPLCVRLYLVSDYVRQLIGKAAAGIQESPRRRPADVGKHGERSAGNPRGAARSRRELPGGQTTDREYQAKGHGRGGAER